MVMPMSRTARSIVRIALVNSALGAIPAVVIAIFQHITAAYFLDLLWTGLVFSNCIGVLAWNLLPRVAKGTFRLRQAPRWTMIILALLAVAVVGCFTADLILWAIGLFPAAVFWQEFSYTLRLCILITLTFGLGMSVYESLRARLQATTLELHTRELAEERANKMAAEAQLSSLESRVHPHFLFNTLNSISALIREDPTRAERMVERLAALLRFSLDSNQARLASLRQELKIVVDYLEIEKARFGERLRYSVETPPDLDDFEVPPMSIQTLVENSVKYAVSPRREGAEVRVRAWTDAGRLLLEVADSGPGFDRACLKLGHGLDLLQSRLAATFGTDAALEIAGKAGAMRVTVSLPQHAVAPPAQPVPTSQTAPSI
jgi:two-component system sensor histidine kinase AlgZ